MSYTPSHTFSLLSTPQLLRVHSCPPVSGWAAALKGVSGRKTGYHPLLDSFSHPAPGRMLYCSDGCRRQGDERVRYSTPRLSHTHTHTPAEVPQAFVNLITMGRGDCRCLAVLAPIREEILKGK